VGSCAPGPRAGLGRPLPGGRRPQPAQRTEWVTGRDRLPAPAAGGWAMPGRVGVSAASSRPLRSQPNAPVVRGPGPVAAGLEAGPRLEGGASVGGASVGRAGPRRPLPQPGAALRGGGGGGGGAESEVSSGGSPKPGREGPGTPGGRHARPAEGEAPGGAGGVACVSLCVCVCVTRSAGRAVGAVGSAGSARQGGHWRGSSLSPAPGASGDRRSSSLQRPPPRPAPPRPAPFSFPSLSFSWSRLVGLSGAASSPLSSCLVIRSPSPTPPPLYRSFPLPLHSPPLIEQTKMVEGVGTLISQPGLAQAAAPTPLAFGWASSHPPGRELALQSGWGQV
jgi:hypothetical protein